MNNGQSEKDVYVKERGEAREEIAALRISEVEHERAKNELRRCCSDLDAIMKEHTAAPVGFDSTLPGEVTEHRRVDEELLESEWRLEAVFECATEGILLADIRTKKLVYGNSAISRMLGYSQNEIKTLRIQDIHRQENLPWILDKFEKLAQTQISSSEGIPVQRKDGSIFYADITTYRFRVGAVTYATGIFRDVTERKRVEEELRKSEVKFRAIFNNTSDGVFLVDLRARKFFMCNASCATMLGYSQEEFSDLDIADIHPGEDLPFIYEQIAKFSRGEEGIRSDIRFKRKDGSIFVTDLSPALLTIAEKEYLVICFRDITERKRAEVALCVSEQWFRALVETTSDFVWEVDQNCFYSYASPKVRDLLGYDPKEVIGKKPFDFMPTDEAERIAKVFCAAAESRKPFAGLENINLHKDGRRVVLETSGVPILDAKGDLVGYRGIDRDITERKQAEKRQTEDRRLLRTLVDTLPDFIYVKDKDGRFLLANKALMDFLGVATEEEINGKTDFDFLPMDQATRYYADEQVVVNSGQAMINKQELWVDTARGNRWNLITKVPLRDQDGKIIGLVSLNRDISDLKQAEEKYRSIFENSTVGVFQCTPQGEFLAVNPAFARIFGHESWQGVVDITRDFAYQAHYRADAGRAFEQLMEQRGELQDFEFEAFRRDRRKIWVKGSAHVVRDNKGRLAYYEGFLQDVTAQKEAEEELKQEAQRIIEAQEAERKRVAHSLHDSVSQLLSAAKFRLASAGEKIFDQPQKSCSELNDSSTLIEKAVQEIRRIIQNLRPAVLDDLGLLPAVHSLCEELRERTKMTLTFRGIPKQARFATKIELALFRIVQEALNNIEKHSRATRSSVSIVQKGASLQVKVKDNGTGFSPVAARNKSSKHSGYGLHSMTERAASIGGKTEIRSVIGRGTEVIVRIPLNGSRICD